jgi:hypothetical protein
MTETKQDKIYFKSERFNSLLNIIKQYHRIDFDIMRYRSYDFPELNIIDFKKVNDCIFSKLYHLTMTVPGKYYSYIDYNGVRFYKLNKHNIVWTDKLVPFTDSRQIFKVKGEECLSVRAEMSDSKVRYCSTCNERIEGDVILSSSTLFPDSVCHPDCFSGEGTIEALASLYKRKRKLERELNNIKAWE